MVIPVLEGVGEAGIIDGIVEISISAWHRNLSVATSTEGVPPKVV